MTWGRDVLHLFFLFIPVWFLRVGLYSFLAALAGAREHFPDEDQVIPSGSEGSARHGGWPVKWQPDVRRGSTEWTR